MDINSEHFVSHGKHSFESDLGIGAKVTFVHRFGAWWADFVRRERGHVYADCVVVLPSVVKKELQRLHGLGWWSDNPQMRAAWNTANEMDDDEFRTSGLGLETLVSMLPKQPSK